ncbi:MAG: NUDIX hydrolase [Pseudomonadota bacterium]|nr:NUDIX hydrolase [Pseudomonadota bacterium]
MELDPPIPAATLIVFRASAAGPPDILIVERAAAMAFAGGAIVFPGGRVDSDDVALATALGHPADAARITAIRETVEESAVLVGLRSTSGAIESELGLMFQDGLLSGAQFGDLLARHDLTLDLDALTAFARWMPAFKQARRFDTMFFIASALPGSWLPRPQPGECQSARWATACDLLDRIEAGDDHAIFPTKRNLERIARFATIEEARADTALYPLDTIIPWVEQRDGAPHVCLPEDRGYPVTSEPLETAFRA